MTAHQRSVIETYKSGLSLRQTAAKYAISHQRVAAIIRENEPETLRHWLFNKLCKGRRSLQFAQSVSHET